MATYLTAADVLQPALLVLQGLLSAHAPLLHKERTFGTGLVVLVTVMWHLRVATSFCTLAGIPAWWRLGTARERRVKDGTAATTTDLVKNGFATCPAGTLVAKLFAKVCTTLQETATLPGANVFRLEQILHWPGRRVQRPLLALAALTFSGFTLAGATSLVAAVASAVQQRSADSHALRRLVSALVTKRR